MDFIVLCFGKHTLKCSCFSSWKSGFNLFLKFFESCFNEHSTFALHTEISVLPCLVFLSYCILTFFFCFCFLLLINLVFLFRLCLYLCFEEQLLCLPVCTWAGGFFLSHAGVRERKRPALVSGAAMLNWCNRCSGAWNRPVKSFTSEEIKLDLKLAVILNYSF